MEITKDFGSVAGHSGLTEHMPLHSGEGEGAIGNDLKAGSCLGVCNSRVELELMDLISDLQPLKYNEKTWASEFCDDEFLSLVLDNVMEEHALLEVELLEPSPCQFSLYRTVECSISDERQKSWVLNSSHQELRAITLLADQAHEKVGLSLSTYVSPTLPVNSGLPTMLRIAGTELYLSCTELSGKITLSLENVTDAGTLDIIEGDKVRFLFYKKSSGLSMSSFESVQFPGWFISTSSADKKPVEMCQIPNSGRITCFVVKQI